MKLITFFIAVSVKVVLIFLPLLDIAHHVAAYFDDNNEC